MNYSNFNEKLERLHQSDADWKFSGLSQPSMISIPLDEREDYLPIGETQFDQYCDFNDCASRSPVNALEALFTYHYTHAMLPTNQQWLFEQGYVQNGKVAFSDRFISILSGTTHEGNSLKAPVDTIYHSGLIPKILLPKTDDMDWDTYYDRSQITQELLDLGQEFRARFKLNYEQVASVHFADVLKDDMVGVAAAAWPIPVNGVYPKMDGPFNHAFLLYNLPKYQIYDNYTEQPGDFTKNLAPDYEFFDTGYRVFLSNEVDVALEISLMQKVINLLKQLLAQLIH